MVLFTLVPNKLLSKRWKPNGCESNAYNKISVETFGVIDLAPLQLNSLPNQSVLLSLCTAFFASSAQSSNLLTRLPDSTLCICTVSFSIFLWPSLSSLFPSSIRHLHVFFCLLARSNPVLRCPFGFIQWYRSRCCIVYPAWRLSSRSIQLTETLYFQTNQTEISCFIMIRKIPEARQQAGARCRRGLAPTPNFLADNIVWWIEIIQVPYIELPLLTFPF